MKALPNGSIRGRQSKSCDAVAPDIHLFAERASEARCASQRKLTGKEGDVVGVSTEGGNIIPGRKMYIHINHDTETEMDEPTAYTFKHL